MFKKDFSRESKDSSAISGLTRPCDSGENGSSDYANLEISLKECFMIMYLDCKHKVAGCLINAVEKDSKIQVLLVILVSRLCDLL